MVFFFKKLKKKCDWKKKVVSTQDEAGLATRRVSSAACDTVGSLRRFRGLWLLLLLLLLCIIGTFCRFNRFNPLLRITMKLTEVSFQMSDAGFYK